MIKIYPKIGIVWVVFFIFAVSRVYADSCSEVFAKGSAAYDAGGAAMSAGQYEKAIRLFNDAQGYYSLVAGMKNCRCPKIAGASKNNVQIAASMAEKCRQAQASKSQYNAEMVIYEQYNEATKKYQEGDSLARQGQWDGAIAAYTQAAVMWEKIAGVQNNANAANAAESAKLARMCIKTAQTYKAQQQEEGAAAPAM